MKSLIKKLTPDFLINSYYYFKAFLSALIFGFPSLKVSFLAITGTKGKTTTCYLLYKMLKQAGLNTALISSLYVSDGKRIYKSPYTLSMPTVFQRDKFIRQAINNKVTYVVQEITSEGIKNKRHLFCKFLSAVILNLEPEHIEHHGGFENYKKAKLELFKITAKQSLSNAFFVINLDDENLKDFIQVGDKIKKIGVSLNNNLKNKNLDLSEIVSIQKLSFKLDRTTFKLGKTTFTLYLKGTFNLYNALLAISVAKQLGISFKKLAKTLKKIKTIAGRFEIIKSTTSLDKPTVIIDYAHTPRSFEEVFKTALPYCQNKGKIIAVFGSAGGIRDKWKRPLLGTIAARYAKTIILTTEDPYDEDPEKIIEDIYKGIIQTSNFNNNHLKVYKILDRSQAIKVALKLAYSKDVILLLGKGSEQVIHLKNRIIPWNDKKTVLHHLSTISILH